MDVRACSFVSVTRTNPPYLGTSPSSREINPFSPGARPPFGIGDWISTPHSVDFSGKQELLACYVFTAGKGMYRVDKTKYICRGLDPQSYAVKSFGVSSFDLRGAPAMCPGEYQGVLLPRYTLTNFATTHHCFVQPTCMHSPAAWTCTQSQSP